MTAKTAKFTVRAMQPNEIHQVSAGMVQAFPLSLEMRHWLESEWATCYTQRPNYHAAMHRVGVVENRVVAHALVEPHTLRYGRSALRVMGIGKVYTDAPYRGRGLAAAVMQDALTYAVEQRAHLAMLDGIRGYYTRFGFSAVLPKYYVEFDAAEVACLDAPLMLREATPDDLPVMATLYERHWGGRVAFERHPELWIWRYVYGDDAFRALVVAPGDGEPQGYIAAASFTHSQVEVIADTPDAALTLLSAAGRWALEIGKPKVRWLMPPDDAFIAFAQQIVPLTIGAHFEPDGGFMARVIDAAGLVSTLLPELLMQANSGLMKISAKDLMLKVGTDEILIGLKSSPETYARLTHRDFIQMIFGTLSPATLGLRDHLPVASVQLLQALFPPRVGALGGWDWF